MELTTLQELYIDQLRDLYSAEKQLTKALPKMAKAAGSDELRKAFEDHLEVTREQLDRLDRIFDELGAKPGRKVCEAMKGLLEEGDHIIKADGADEVRDAGLIAAAQRVEHYEIAGYGTVRSYAEALGYDKAARLLQKTLDEEGETDHLLTELATSDVNPKAAQAQAA
jgi:ferritin-like metal-binding protein YciE